MIPAAFETISRGPERIPNGNSVYSSKSQIYMQECDITYKPHSPKNIAVSESGERDP